MFDHIPVLRAEVVTMLAPKDGEVFIDCTLGGAGHTCELLRAADCSVIGVDRDPAALAAATQNAAEFGDRFTAVRATFGEIGSILDNLGIESVDGILADIGVSSHQLDTADRGFSFRRSGPIDMRMDPDAPFSAEHVVNSWDETKLANAIYTLGEERRSRPVARAIVAGRPWTDTV
ncbi:MAG: 16S rRNA (cytosine(1402)-N(4))-methyltransferase RsmH, partial [Rhodobacterales bacterium]|nr:16S rRNA (cytosine(1402)-N(4))-methyltransferase RsmH [Rhodobacterales bacterium]